MAKDKLKRFTELKTFSNVIEHDIKPLLNNQNPIQGKWKSMYFLNGNPIVLELGCGKGEYTIQLAEKYSDRNFIGIDIKGARLWVGAKQAIEKKLQNVIFLRTRIDFINSFFASDEVDEIWITFPDPQEKNRRKERRLTSSAFLNKYKTFLKKDGRINLKTDNDILYNYTLQLIKKNNLKLLNHTFDLYNSELIDKSHAITTFYEKKFLIENKPIHFLQFTFDGIDYIKETNV